MLPVSRYAARKSSVDAMSSSRTRDARKRFFVARDLLSFLQEEPVR
jgi:hypothetical protein